MENSPTHTIKKNFTKNIIKMFTLIAFLNKMSYFSGLVVARNLLNSVANTQAYIYTYTIPV